MRCRKCWAFGHTTTRCRNTPVCSYCGLRGHIKEECTRSQDPTRIHCVNCHGQHEASSANCPKYVENFEIIKFAHNSKPSLPFKEAQKKWLSLNPRNVRSATTPTTTLEQTAVKTSYANVASGQAHTDSDSLHIAKAEFEAVVFNQMLLANIIKNIIVSQHNSEAMDVVFKAMNDIAVELGTYLDNKKIKLTPEHLKLIEDSNAAFENEKLQDLPTSNHQSQILEEALRNITDPDITSILDAHNQELANTSAPPHQQPQPSPQQQNQQPPLNALTQPFLPNQQPQYQYQAVAAMATQPSAYTVACPQPQFAMQPMVAPMSMGPSCPFNSQPMQFMAAPIPISSTPQNMPAKPDSITAEGHQIYERNRPNGAETVKVRVILPPLQTGQFYNEAYVLERADVILKEHNEKQHSKKLPQRQLMPKINVVDSKSPNK
jgi:hypothetical protein